MSSEEGVLVGLCKVLTTLEIEVVVIALFFPYARRSEATIEGPSAVG